MGARCTECGWEGEWREVHVDRADGTTGPDPAGEHVDPPYYCPDCGEKSVAEDVRGKEDSES